MENVNLIEDEFHVKLSEPVDLEELCKLDSKGSEFEVCMPTDQPENYFDQESVFKQLNDMYDWVNNLEGNESGEEDQTPSFEKLARHMVAVIGDGGVRKKVIKVGSGEVIEEGYTAIVHYNGYFEYCDEPYDSTRLRNHPEKLKLGDGQVIEGLEIAVSTMRKGELSQFLVQPQYAFGAMGVPPRIPADATILFEVELLNISDTPIGADLDTWTAEKRKAATFDEILEVANAARKAGNELYQDKRISKAVFKYVKAIQLLEGARLANQSEEDEMNRVKLKLYLNMSICNIKQGQYVRALSNCTKALEIDPENVKAVFRRGQALLRTGEFDRAHKWLTKALKLSPRNSAIVAELKELESSRAKFELLNRNMCTRMFATSKSTKKDGDKAKDDKMTNKQKKCPPEVQELLKTKLKAFSEDKTLAEMPFALDTLTTAETEYIQQAALEMGLQVRALQQNSEKYLKIFKLKTVGEQ